MYSWPSCAQPTLALILARCATWRWAVFPRASALTEHWRWWSWPWTSMRLCDAAQQAPLRSPRCTCRAAQVHGRLQPLLGLLQCSGRPRTLEASLSRRWWKAAPMQRRPCGAGSSHFSLHATAASWSPHAARAPAELPATSLRVQAARPAPPTSSGSERSSRCRAERQYRRVYLRSFLRAARAGGLAQAPAGSSWFFCWLLGAWADSN
mmetsp:Transcript_106538/g.333237  ORF Transcript_106538/g.333237 Transcript_106538/m.333237 type:complete len:208 (-) Transcript_106538:1-624(-)